MSTTEPTEQLPPQGHVRVVYLGPVAPHWEVQSDFGDPRVIDDAPVGRYFRDGRLLVPEADGPVRQRRKLSVVGIVMISLTLSRKGAVLADPLAVIDGVPEVTADGEAMLDVVLDAVDGTLRSIPQGGCKSADTVAEAVRRAVRAAVDRSEDRSVPARLRLPVVGAVRDG